MSVLIDCKARIKPKIEKYLAVVGLLSVFLTNLASYYEWSGSIRFTLGLPALFYIVLIVGTKANIWEQVKYEHGKPSTVNDKRNA